MHLTAARLRGAPLSSIEDVEVLRAPQRALAAMGALGILVAAALAAPARINPGNGAAPSPLGLAGSCT